jgi:transcriptional regulator with XRE-family HTH domain
VILQQLCAARGLTLAQLAERAGVPLATVVHLDASTTRAQPVTLRRLAAALGLAPEALRAELSEARRRWAERNTMRDPGSMHP